MTRAEGTLASPFYGGGTRDVQEQVFNLCRPMWHERFLRPQVFNDHLNKGRHLLGHDAEGELHMQGNTTWGRESIHRVRTTEGTTRTPASQE